MVTGLLCTEGTEDADLVDAAKLICGGRVECGAWIWMDAAHVPDALPDTHEGLDQDAVLNAYAVWINGNQQLVKLQKAE